MINARAFGCALLLLGGVTAVRSQETSSEFLAPADAVPKGSAPRMRVQLQNPGEQTEQDAVIFYEGDEAFCEQTWRWSARTDEPRRACAGLAFR